MGQGWTIDTSYEGPRGFDDATLTAFLAVLDADAGGYIGLNIDRDHWTSDGDGMVKVQVSYATSSPDSPTTLPPAPGAPDYGLLERRWTRQYEIENVAPIFSETLYPLARKYDTFDPVNTQHQTGYAGTMWLAGIEEAAKQYLEDLAKWYADTAAWDVSSGDPEPGDPPGTPPNPGEYLPTPPVGAANAEIYAAGQAFALMIRAPEKTAQIASPVITKQETVQYDSMVRAANANVGKMLTYLRVAEDEPTLLPSGVINVEELSSYVWLKSWPEVDRSTGGALNLNQEYIGFKTYEWCLYGDLVKAVGPPPEP